MVDPKKKPPPKQPKDPPLLPRPQPQRPGDWTP